MTLPHRPRTVFVTGATSAIAQACLRCWVGRADRFVLAGRQMARLEELAQDLRARGASFTQILTMDAGDPESLRGMAERAREALGGIDVALIAHGVLTDQAACERDAALAVQAWSVNAASVLVLMTELATVFEAQRHGALAVITSVAGDRGRPSNVVYGSSKAALQALCEGMRPRLFRAGCSLTDVRPGFIDTPMTRGLRAPAGLTVQPHQIAPRIVAAVDAGADVVYVPGLWRWIMAAVRSLPQFVYKRVRL